MTTGIITINQSPTPYVPFGGADVELGEEAIAPTPEHCLLQYATGLPAQRPKLGTDGREMYDEDTGEQLFDSVFYAGFFTEAGKDRALDEAMLAKGIPSILIAHSNGEVKRHWALQKPTVFLLAKGIPSNGEGKGELGLVYTWRTPKNGGAPRSVLYAQVMVRQLLPHYAKPLIFTCKSTQTRDALTAFNRQYRVLARAREAYRQATQKDIALPLWSYAMTLGPSSKQDRRGTGENSRVIYPMLGSVPDEVDLKYLQRYEVSSDYIDFLRGATDDAVEWATAKMAAIVAGTEPHEPWADTTDQPKAS